MLAWASTLFPGSSWMSRWTLTPPSLPAYYYSGFQDWGRWETRLTRYDFFWSWWTNSPYDSAHLWAGQFRTLYALYKYTRGCYNPMFRLGEFWATTVWGGRLSTEKVGGRVVQSACPILTDNDGLRPAIARLWEDSNWQTYKQVCCRYGAVKGDVGLRVDVDREGGKVRILPVNPDTIRWIQLDYDGNTLAYELWEPRWDPRFDAKSANPATPGAGQMSVIYQERCYSDGGRVTFETFLNGAPYGWYGRPSRWTLDVPFVPFILHPHVQMHTGFFWGVSEYQTAFRKSMELDDVASKHHDQIRKAADPKWFLAGVNRPKDELTLVGKEASRDNPQPGRQELPFLYGGLGSSATAMVFPLDNQFVSVEVQNQLAALEKDYPELRYDSARASGDASAKALREVRKSAEAKVHDRRAGYDAALVRAQKMALCLGGLLGFEGYDGLGRPDLADPKLAHAIGERSVFLMDPLDRIEEEQALATCWLTFKQAGWPDAFLMDRFGFSEGEKSDFEGAQEQDRGKELALAPPGVPAPPPGGRGAPPPRNGRPPPAPVAAPRPPPP